MAVLNGLHVVCSRIGGKSKRVNGAKADFNVSDILNSVIWSETLTSGGSASAEAAPAPSDEGDVVFYCIPSANGWLSLGDTGGTPSANPRIFLRANDPPFAIFVTKGYKAKWLVDA